MNIIPLMQDRVQALLLMAGGLNELLSLLFGKL